MKKKFSRPLNIFWKELYGTQKRLTPYLSDEQNFRILRSNLLTAPFTDDDNAESRELQLSGLELWWQDATGDLLHIFFLQSTLRDFLQETRLSDLDGLRQYLYESGMEKEVVYFATKTRTNCVIYNYGLSLPYETDGYAFSLGLFDDNSIELYFAHGHQNGRLSDKFYNDLNKQKDDRSVALARYFRLAINTIAYMKCFPECVFDGVPKIVKDSKEVKATRSINVSLSEAIIESNKSGKSKQPHFRRGYFKTLESDFYTQKRGQVIFVSETMVKGRAKTVSACLAFKNLKARQASKVKKQRNSLPLSASQANVSAPLCVRCALCGYPLAFAGLDKL